MLIKFQSEGAAPFEMLRENALMLVALMGQGERVEGAISGAAIAAAQASLEAGLARLEAEVKNRQDAAEATIGEAEDEAEDEDEEPPVNLRIRAVPLKELLEHAAQNNSYVMWRPA